MNYTKLYGLKKTPKFLISRIVNNEHVEDQPMCRSQHAPARLQIQMRLAREKIDQSKERLGNTVQHVQKSHAKSLYIL
jgi:hypothetical protein